jgi:hypothetical protein
MDPAGHHLGLDPEKWTRDLWLGSFGQRSGCVGPFVGGGAEITAVRVPSVRVVARPPQRAGPPGLPHGVKVPSTTHCGACVMQRSIRIKKPPPVYRIRQNAATVMVAPKHPGLNKFRNGANGNGIKTEGAVGNSISRYFHISAAYLRYRRVDRRHFDQPASATGSALLTLRSGSRPQRGNFRRGRGRRPTSAGHTLGTLWSLISVARNPALPRALSLCRPRCP